VETVEAGWNKLAGVDPEAIKTAFERWHPQRERALLYGDGHAAEEISDILANALK